jgi:hypothetical protein
VAGPQEVIRLRQRTLGNDMHRRRYGYFFRVASSALRAIPMSCTDEDGGVVPIRRTTREARWRTFVQPS